MTNDVSWKPEIENVDNIGIEDIKFIHAQVEKRLDHTIRIASNISDKVTSLATLLGGILIGLVGYIISQPFLARNPKIAISIVAFAYVFMVAFALLKNMLPRHYHMSGFEPRHILVNDFFKDTFKTDDFSQNRTTVHLYMAAIESYQLRIDENEHENNKRWTNYNLCMKASIFMPLILGFIYFVFS